MPDTIRLITDFTSTIFADGQATGSITPQDMRDLAVTIGSLASVFDVKAYGAKGDGVTDDRAAIQAAIDAANAAGGGVVYFPPGIYAFASINPGAPTQGILECESKSDLYFVGAGIDVSVLRCKTGTNFSALGDSHFFSLKRSSNMSWQNMTMDGNYSNCTWNGEQNHGIRLAESQNIYVCNVKFTNIRGDSMFTVSDLAADITGTAQAGTATTITLAAGSSSDGALFVGRTITLTGGTGSGQSRVIASYVGATKVATVSVAWTTTPDATSTYNVVGIWTENVTMHHTQHIGNNRSGTAHQGGSRQIDISHSYYSGISDGSIDMEGTGGRPGCRDVTWSFNTVEHFALTMATSFTGTTEAGGETLTGLRVIGNTIRGGGMQVGICTGAVISGNVIINRTNQTALSIHRNVIDSVISDNYIKNETYAVPVVTCQSSTDILLRPTRTHLINNRIVQAQAQYAVFIDNSSEDLVVAGNEMSGAGIHGAISAVQNNANHPVRGLKIRDNIFRNFGSSGVVVLSTVSTSQFYDLEIVGNHFVDHQTTPTQTGIAILIDDAGNYFLGTTRIGPNFYDANITTKISTTGGGDFTPLMLWDRGGAVKTWDPASVAAAGLHAAETITVTGAKLGHQVRLAFSLDLQGLVLYGNVSAADTVKAYLYNPTAGAINLGSGTLSALLLNQ